MARGSWSVIFCSICAVTVRILHCYLRWIEMLLVELLAQYELMATTRDGLTGIWVQNPENNRAGPQDRLDRRWGAALDHNARLRAQRQW